MPEGPELHLASLYVNRMCEGVVFSGAVVKSEVSKSPDVAFSCPAYRISATSRGKEVRLTLAPLKGECGGEQEEEVPPLDIVFRFGMSGFFRFTPEAELPKHAHLRFFTRERPRRALSFVDARRFGSWQPGAAWQAARGPCVMFQYQSFRQNVVSHLSDRAFDRPVCEVLLNQKYFNGIGNYLRAEILFRLNIPPFVSARSVLEGLAPDDPCWSGTADKLKEQKLKEGAGDLLRLCHTVPLEVVGLGGKGYDPEKKDYSAFEAWLRCYYVDGMRSIRDHNGRTMWFRGDPGPLAPKETKTPQAKKRAKKADDGADKKKVAADSKVSPDVNRVSLLPTQAASKRSRSRAAQEEEGPGAKRKMPKQEVRRRRRQAQEVKPSRRSPTVGRAGEPLRRSTRTRRNRAQ